MGTRFILIDGDARAHDLGDDDGAAVFARLYLEAGDGFDRLNEAIELYIEESATRGRTTLATRRDVDTRAAIARFYFRRFRRAYFRRPEPRPRPALRELERRGVSLAAMLATLYGAGVDAPGSSR